MLKTAEENVAQAPPASGRLAKARSIEWLGQTVASLAWIVSVFVYGLSSAGDALQLLAASAWFVANIAALLSAGSGAPTAAN
ncbi:MAG: hypothetical protein AAFP86_01805 [Planctomycetota bacterium]